MTFGKMWNNIRVDLTVYCAEWDSFSDGVFLLGVHMKILISWKAYILAFGLHQFWRHHIIKSAGLFFDDWVTGK